MSADRKRRAAQQAAAEVQDGDVVGLGSGSTAAYAIRAIGERVHTGLDIVGVPTSYQAADLARSVGIPVRAPADVPGITIAIDGADQVAANQLIKGGGGAHAREKVIDSAANRFLVVVDEGKLSDVLDEPIPVEVLPDARPLVAEWIRTTGGEPTVRETAPNNGPAITENGNQILDCAFGVIEDPASLASTLDAIPGVLDHGLFIGIADAVYVGTADTVEVHEY